MSGITFDAGGLIAFDRNDRRVLSLLARATQRGMRVTIPATALAQAIRNPARQDATAVGLLLAQTETADIVDAHVVVCAQRAGQAVVTSDIIQFAVRPRRFGWRRRYALPIRSGTLCTLRAGGA